MDRLLVMTVLAVALGNLDMRHQNTEGRMVMAVNGVDHHAALSVADLVAEATSWQMRAPQSLILRTLRALDAFAASEEPDRRAHPELQGDVRTFTRRLLAGKPVG